MNKIIDLRMNIGEVLVTLLIYLILTAFAFLAAARFERLGLNTNYITENNMMEFILE